MSFEQGWSIPTLSELFRLITKSDWDDGKIINAALRFYTNETSRIAKIEPLLIDDDLYRGQIYGMRVILNNGEIYETSLEENWINESCNVGCKIYKWKRVK